MCKTDKNIYWQLNVKMNQTYVKKTDLNNDLNFYTNLKIKKAIYIYK